MNLFPLMPVLPLLGFVFLSAFGKRMREPWPGIIASLMVGLAFVLALIGFFDVRTLEEGAQFRQVLWDFLPGIGERGGALPMAFTLDQLSSLMTLIITGVGFLIHIYSIGYMHGDKGFPRFFAYLNFFVAMMLVLVLADSFPVVFIGWEGVGVASFLLIGFWYRERINADAARKAFIVNRIGDVFFLLAMLLIYKTFGTLIIRDVLEQAADFAYNVPVLNLIGVFLLLGAAGKSAQLPLSTWLPDAMAGPTPVSALIHAATMVTAGVYLVARSHTIFAQAGDASNWLSVVGILTALYGAISALAQTDIKRILAFSTISQLGYMFLALGSGMYWVALFHVTTHAFFKALLFLAAGNVIHALGGEQDVRQMGGLRRALPATYAVSLIGVLAISGIIPFAGFFSKDAILTSTFTNPFLREFAPVIWFLGILVAVSTAIYMARWFLLVFRGQYRGQAKAHAHLHENPSVMLWPLFVLAALSVVGGFIGLPHLLGEHANLIAHFLEPVIPNAIGTVEPGAVTEIVLIVLALAAGVLGLGLAVLWYRRAGAAAMGNVPGKFGETSQRALYLDDAYTYGFNVPANFVAEGLAVADAAGTKGSDQLVGRSLLEASGALGGWQSGLVRAYGLTIFIASLLFVVFALIRGGGA